MLRKLFTILFILAALVTQAETLKEYKELKACIKNSNVGRGREIINKCISDTLFNTDPQFYAFAVAIEKKANDAENMKLYLKQKYDTAAFFNSIYKMFEYSKMQDELYEKQGEKVFKKFRTQSASILKPYYPNLYNGGVYFVKKKDWKNACNLFTMYIAINQLNILDEKSPQTQAKLPRAAFWCMTSCFENKDYEGVFKYPALAEADTANINYVLQYEVLSYEQLKDTANYVARLKDGLRITSDEFFFSRLTDYYNERSDYNSAYLLNDSLLKIQPKSTLYLYAQTIALFNMTQYDQCIENSLKLLEISPEHPQANYYVGLSWYNKAQEMDRAQKPNPTSKQFREHLKQVNQLFANAMPYLEKYRALAPKDKDRWQAPLYRIYYNLNMSDKLKELEEK